MKIIKDLWLSVLLIVVASAILLLSDLEQRKPDDRAIAKQFPRIAIMQISNTPLLDTHVAGIVEGLRVAGLLDETGSNLMKYNALGDLSLANTIAREIVSGPAEIVITSSTLALQTFAKANQQRQKTHVFGAVTDPYGAGVGIVGTEAANHPPYLCGIGTFQPVEKSFRIARDMNPRLTKVGVVWNSGEQCSEACMREARMICKELDIELVEAVANSTSEVAEALRSLVARGVEAIWIGGDTVATAASSMIFNLAGQHRIPVFTNDPLDAERGAIFGLGADYFTVGKMTAALAAGLLNGKKASEVKIENRVPEKLLINDSVMQSYALNWKPGKLSLSLINATESLKQDESLVIDFAVANASNHSTEMLLRADQYRNVHLRTGKKATVAVINLVENHLLEEAVRGVEKGMQQSGLVKDVDYEMKTYSAQGEIAQLPQIIDAVVRQQPDVIVSVTTPAMMAVVSRVKDIPVVLTVCSNPFKLNLFKNGRASNVCGVHDNPPIDSLVQMALDYLPGCKTFGIVYDASQMNSVLSVEKLRLATKNRGLRLEEATASNVAELSMATQAVIQRGAQAIVVSADNLVSTGFASILRVAGPAGVPIFATEPQLVAQGATGALGDSFTDWGIQSGKLVARVLAGVAPADLPLTETEKHTRIEPKSTSKLQKRNAPLKLRIVQYSETAFAERCHDGLMAGLERSGLKEGVDYEMKTYNAQGDMTTLSSIMTTVKADRVDLLMVVSTPTLQAALRQAGPETRIVFTGVGDGVKAGAGKSETDHLPNVTGITTRSPFEGMAALIRQTLPNCQRIGTLFTPAEINSVMYKNWFADALQKYGISLVAVPVTSSADIAMAADELCRNNIQLIAQIVDNLTRPGFALIARKGDENNLPVFIFDSDQMADGATLCLARDYFDAGLEAAEKAVRVLNGENPASIPFSNTQSEKLIINQEKVKKYQLKLTPALVEKATIFPQK